MKSDTLFVYMPRAGTLKAECLRFLQKVREVGTSKNCMLSNSLICVASLPVTALRFLLYLSKCKASAYFARFLQDKGADQRKQPDNFAGRCACEA